MDLTEPYKPSPHLWFPRTSGDGPILATWPMLIATVSPHERGWTLAYLSMPRHSGGFPARAGMDRLPGGAGDVDRRFPRTSGDGPITLTPSSLGDVVSPHERGWTPSRTCQPSMRAGFPARAGMDPATKAPITTHSRFPRTSGDGPFCRCRVLSLESVSPHERGWTHHHVSTVHHPVGFPARAGMDPCRGATSSHGRRFPRTSGDGPDGEEDHPHLIGTIGETDCLREALFEPWKRPDATFSFRWDPHEDVRYALRATDPTDSKTKETTQHGANRLAAIGLSVLTVVPRLRGVTAQLGVVGGRREHRGGFVFTWPIWRHSISLAAIRALLGHAGLDKRATWDALGIFELRRARRISVGRFMNVTRAESIDEPEAQTRVLRRHGVPPGSLARAAVSAH